MPDLREKAAIDEVDLEALGSPQLAEATIYHPAGIQFFFGERTSLPNNYVSIKCRLTDGRDEPRQKTYYVVLSLEKIDGKFPMEIYTENEYDHEKIEGAIERSHTTPVREGADAQAIDRYVQHERHLDTWIREKMRHKSNYIEIGPERMDDFLYVVFSTVGPLANLDRAFGGKLESLIKGRKIYLVRVRAGETLPVIMEDGKEIPVGSHASENALYVFMDETREPTSLPRNFDNLRHYLEHGTVRGPGGDSLSGQSALIEASNIAVTRIVPKLIHEIGVICGLEYEVTDGGEIINDLDRLYNEAIGKNYEGIIQLSLTAAVRPKLIPVDLDELRGGPEKPYERDYALKQESGPSGETPLERKINAIWKELGTDINKPFLGKAQAAFRDIYEVYDAATQRERDALSVYVSSKGLYAVLFRYSDYSTLVDYYKALQKEFRRNPAVRDAFLEDEELLTINRILFFTSAMMDFNMVREFRKKAEENEGFFEYHARMLFGDDVEVRDEVIHVMREARAIFKETIFDHILHMALRHTANGLYAEALQILDNCRTCVEAEMRLELDATRSEMAEALSAIEEARAAIMLAIDAEGMEREIERIWTISGGEGRQIKNVFFEHTQEGLEKICDVDDLRQELDLPYLSLETQYKVCFARLFRRGDAKNVIAYFEAMKEMPEHREIMASNQFLSLYYTARLLQKGAVEEAGQAGEGYFRYWAKDITDSAGETDEIVRRSFATEGAGGIAFFLFQGMMLIIDHHRYQTHTTTRALILAKRVQRLLACEDSVTTVDEQKRTIRGADHLFRDIHEAIMAEASDRAHIAPEAAQTILKPLTGREHKDIARITIGLQPVLETAAGNQHTLISKRMLRTMGTVQAQQDTQQNSRVFFDFNQSSYLPNGYAATACSIIDDASPGGRVYVAIYSLKRNADGTFPVAGVLTTDEAGNAHDILSNYAREKKFPERRKRDREAIARYIQHEAYDRNVIRWVHKHVGDGVHLYLPGELGFSYKEMVDTIVGQAHARMSLRDLESLRDRKCYIVSTTQPVRMRLSMNPVQVITKGGEVKEVKAHGHSSNDAVHIFLDYHQVNALRRAVRTKHTGREDIKTIYKTIEGMLAHEVGVMLGCPALRFEDDTPVNEIDERYRTEKKGALRAKRFQVADLDVNLLTRDYALMAREPDEKREPEGGLPSALEETINTAWESVPDILNNPFSAEAQEAFSTILLSYKPHIQENVVLSFPATCRILCAYLFREADYEGTLRYSKSLRARFKGSRSFREEVLHDEENLRMIGIMHCTAATMEPGGIERYARETEKREGFFEFRMEELFGADVDREETLGASPEERWVFKESVLKHVSGFALQYMTEGRPADALQLLDNCEEILKVEEALHLDIPTVRGGRNMPLLAISQAKESMQDALTAQGITNEINRIWTTVETRGENISLFSTGTRRANKLICLMDNLRREKGFPIAEIEAVYRICCGRLFGEGDYEETIKLLQGVREMSQWQEVLVTPPFLALYFTARMLEPGSAAKATGAQDNFFHFYGQELFETAEVLDSIGDSFETQGGLARTVINTALKAIEYYQQETREEERALPIAENIVGYLTRERDRLSADSQHTEFLEDGIKRFSALTDELKNTAEIRAGLGRSILKPLEGRAHKEIALITSHLREILRKVAEDEDTRIAKVVLRNLGPLMSSSDPEFADTVTFHINKTIFLPNDYIGVVCNVMPHGSQEAPAYFAVASLKRGEDGVFPVVNVYTESESTASIDSIRVYAKRGTFPERQEQDRVAIERYIEHEVYDQNVIQWAHANIEDGVNMYLPGELGLSYRKMVDDIVAEARIELSPSDLEALKKRPCYIVALTPALLDRVRLCQVTVIARNGATRQYPAYGHSSNKAVHILLEEEKVEALKKAAHDQHAETPKQIADTIERMLAHEVGVMLGCPVVGFRWNQPVNEIDQRYRTRRKSRLRAKGFHVADLDRNLLVRDYALKATGPDAEGGEGWRDVWTEIEATWEATGDDVLKPFDRKAQDAFSAIIDAVGKMGRTIVGPHFMMFKYFYARLFKEGNYRTCVNFVETTTHRMTRDEARGLLADDEYRLEFMLFALTGLMMDSTAVRRFIQRRREAEGFFEYFARELFAREIEANASLRANLTDWVLGLTPNVRARLKDMVIDNVREFALKTHREGHPVEALRILDNTAVCIARETELQRAGSILDLGLKDLEAIDGRVAAIRSTVLEEMTPELIKQEIDSAWTALGIEGKAVRQLDVSSREHFDRICHADYLRTELGFSVPVDYHYKIIFARIFGKGNSEAVSSFFRSLKDPFQRSIVLHDPYFMDLYFLSRFLEPASAGKALSMGENFFMFYAQQVFTDEDNYAEVIGTSLDDRKQLTYMADLLNNALLLTRFRRSVYRDYEGAMAVAGNARDFITGECGAISDPGTVAAVQRLERYINQLKATIESESSHETSTVLRPLKGTEHKDIARIGIGLQSFLQRTAGDRDYLNKALLSPLQIEIAERDTQFGPPVTLYFDGLSHFPNAYVFLRCGVPGESVRDERTYYAVFSLERAPDGTFPIAGIFTEEEFTDAASSLIYFSRERSFPARPQRDRLVIERYLTHEQYDRDVIQWVHDNEPLRDDVAVYRPEELGFRYDMMVDEIISQTRLVLNPRDRRSLWGRACYIVPIASAELEERLRQNMVAVPISDGTSVRVVAYAHSSNHAVHIFLDRIIVDMLKKLKEEGQIATYGGPILGDIKRHLAHEVGVMLGCEALFLTPGGELFNTVDIRYAAGPKLNTQMPLQVRDLDVLVEDDRERDYALKEREPSEDHEDDPEMAINVAWVTAGEKIHEPFSPVAQAAFTVIIEAFRKAKREVTSFFHETSFKVAAAYLYAGDNTGSIVRIAQELGRAMREDGGELRSAIVRNKPLLESFITTSLTAQMLDHHSMQVFLERERQDEGFFEFHTRMLFGDDMDTGDILGSRPVDRARLKERVLQNVLGFVSRYESTERYGKAVEILENYAACLTVEERLNLELPGEPVSALLKQAEARKRSVIEKIEAGTLEREADAVWARVGGEEAFSYATGAAAQRAFREILYLDSLRDLLYILPSIGIRYKVLAATAYGLTDHEKVISFFGSARDLAEKDEILHDSAFLSLYFFARMFEHGSMARAAKAGENFFTYYAREIFPEGEDPVSFVGGSFGDEAQEKMAGAMLDHLFIFCQYYGLITKDYRRAGTLLSNILGYLQYEYRRPSSVDDHHALRLRLLTFTALRDRIASNRAKAEVARAAQVLTQAEVARHVDGAWTGAGDNIYRPFTAEAQAAFRSILEATGSVLSGNIPRTKDIYYKVLRAHLFGAYHYALVTLTFEQHLPRALESIREEVFSDREFLKLYFTARMLELLTPEACKRTSALKKSFFTHYAERLFGTGFDPQTVFGAEPDAWLDFKLDVLRNTEGFIARLTDGGHCREALRLLYNCTRCLRNERALASESEAAKIDEAEKQINELRLATLEKMDQVEPVGSVLEKPELPLFTAQEIEDQIEDAWSAAGNDINNPYSLKAQLVFERIASVLARRLYEAGGSLRLDIQQKLYAARLYSFRIYDYKGFVYSIERGLQDAPDALRKAMLGDQDLLRMYFTAKMLDARSVGKMWTSQMSLFELTLHELSRIYGDDFKPEALFGESLEGLPLFKTRVIGLIPYFGTEIAKFINPFEAERVFDNCMRVLHCEREYAHHKIDGEMIHNLEMMTAVERQKLDEGPPEGPEGAEAQQGGPRTASGADSDIKRMTDLERVYSADEKRTSEYFSYQALYEDIVTAIREVSNEIAAKFKDDAILTDRVGVIPKQDGDEGCTLAVRVDPASHARNIGIYQSFIEGMHERLGKLITGEGRTVEQKLLIKALIRAAVYHELGHGFEGYSGMDLYTLVSDDAIRSEFADLLDLHGADGQEIDKWKVAEAIADTAIGGPGNARYTENKGAYLFYKYISDRPGQFITPEGKVDEEVIRERVESYYEKNPHLAKCLGPGDIGKVAAHVVYYYGVFFGEGTKWHQMNVQAAGTGAAASGARTGTGSHAEEIRTLIRIATSEGAHKDERANARSRLAEYGREAFDIVEAQLSGVSSPNSKEAVFLRLTLKTIKDRMQHQVRSTDTKSEVFAAIAKGIDVGSLTWLVALMQKYSSSQGSGKKWKSAPHHERTDRRLARLASILGIHGVSHTIPEKLPGHSDIGGLHMLEEALAGNGNVAARQGDGEAAPEANFGSYQDRALIEDVASSFNTGDLRWLRSLMREYPEDTDWHSADMSKKADERLLLFGVILKMHNIPNAIPAALPGRVECCQLLDEAHSLRERRVLGHYGAVLSTATPHEAREEAIREFARYGQDALIVLSYSWGAIKDSRPASQRHELIVSTIVTEVLKNEARISDISAIVKHIIPAFNPNVEARSAYLRDKAVELARYADAQKALGVLLTYVPAELEAMEDADAQHKWQNLNVRKKLETLLALVERHQSGGTSARQGDEIPPDIITATIADRLVLDMERSLTAVEMRWLMRLMRHYRYNARWQEKGVGQKDDKRILHLGAILARQNIPNEIPDELPFNLGIEDCLQRAHDLRTAKMEKHVQKIIKESPGEQTLLGAGKALAAFGEDGIVILALLWHNAKVAGDRGKSNHIRTAMTRLLAELLATNAAIDREAAKRMAPHLLTVFNPLIGRHGTLVDNAGAHLAGEQEGRRAVMALLEYVPREISVQRHEVRAAWIGMHIQAKLEAMLDVIDESGEHGEPESPVAGTRKRRFGLKHLAPHPIDNALIRTMITTAQEKGLFGKNKFVECEKRKGAGEVYWFGNANDSNESFLDIFNKLVEIHARTQGKDKADMQDRIDVAASLVREAGLDDRITVDETFTKRLEAQLALQIEHFGVESGDMYAMRKFKSSQFKDRLISHALFEREVHLKVIQQVFGNDFTSYRLWRRGAIGAMTIIIEEPNGLGIELKDTMTYNDFAQAAHEFAQDEFAVSDDYVPESKVRTLSPLPGVDVPTAGIAAGETGANLLVVGGDGYIGSATTREFDPAREDVSNVTVYDDMSAGHKKASPSWISHRTGSLWDKKRLVKLLRDRSIDTVVHLAGSIESKESVERPAKYFENNVINTLILLEAMREAGVKRIVFSSSAAVYGTPESVPIEETAILRPENPYGESKLLIEKLLREYAEKHGFKAVTLRYFNAAGALEKCGEDHDPETHMIPLQIRRALAGQDLVIYGDGEHERDYVHIKDLARAHSLAVTWLRGQTGEEGVFEAFNLGSSRRYRNREIVEKVKEIVSQVTKKPCASEIVYKEARHGDPLRLQASTEKAKRILGWEASEESDIENIIRSAVLWHWKHPDGYGDREATSSPKTDSTNWRITWSIRMLNENETISMEFKLEFLERLLKDMIHSLRVNGICPGDWPDQKILEWAAQNDTRDRTSRSVRYESYENFDMLQRSIRRYRAHLGLKRIEEIDTIMDIGRVDTRAVDVIEVMGSRALPVCDEISDCLVEYLNLVSQIDGNYPHEADTRFRESAIYRKIVGSREPVSEDDFRALWQESLHQVRREDIQRVKARIPHALLPDEGTPEMQELERWLHVMLANFRMMTTERIGGKLVALPRFLPTEIRQMILKSDEEREGAPRAATTYMARHLAKKCEFDELCDAMRESGYEGKIRDIEHIFGHTLSVTDDTGGQQIQRRTSDMAIEALVALAREVTGSQTLSIADILKKGYTNRLSRSWLGCMHPGLPYRETMGPIEETWSADLFVVKRLRDVAAISKKAGLEIPTHPDKRYTLLLTTEFFGHGDLKEHKREFGDRFDLDRVSGKTLHSFVDNVLRKAKGIENRTIALVPHSIPHDELKRLTEAGIRFLRTDVNELISYRAGGRAGARASRRTFQLNTYAIMLLARQIERETGKESSLYRALEFYVSTHFDLQGLVSADEYIDAIVRGNIATLLLGYLKHKPAEPYDALEDYEKISEALLSA